MILRLFLYHENIIFWSKKQVVMLYTAEIDIKTAKKDIVLASVILYNEIKIRSKKGSP